MRTPTKILVSGLSCSLLCLLLVGLWHRSAPRRPGGSTEGLGGPAAAAAVGARNWKTMEANMDDPRYVEWLEELRGTEFQEHELFKLMRSNLSPGQKNAAFAKFLRDRAQTGILTANPERWSRELRELALAGYIEGDIAGRVGGMLRNLATPSERSERRHVTARKRTR